jgi:signal transduction histidine kinase
MCGPAPWCEDGIVVNLLEPLVQADRSIEFRARTDRRVLSGVAGGFADQHGVDPALMRVAVALLSLAGGLGVALYALGHAVAARAVEVGPAHPHDRRRDTAVVFITAGLLLVVRSTGVWLGDVPMVAAVVMGVGALVLARSEGRWLQGRVMMGVGLMAAGVLVAGDATGDWHGGTPTSVRVGTLAAALTLVGVGVVAGPWLARLAQRAADERRERIRADERAAVAAHLHDSVLQTLALIQRTADDPRRTVTLARRQERELREWLYGEATATRSAHTFTAALGEIAVEVEDAYDVPVEVVSVGDLLVDERCAVLIAATREACLNAAKHSGAPTVAVFAEVSDGAIEVFVRDRGVGFDPAGVDADRRGVRDSIVGRLLRIGGEASVTTSPGDGTEVSLRVTREPTTGEMVAP